MTAGVMGADSGLASELGRGSTSGADPGLPGLVVGGCASNTGKTVTSMALLCALRARGHAPCAAKIGPDYIDAAYHAALTGCPACNLDFWMSAAPPRTPGEARHVLRRLLGRQREHAGRPGGEALTPSLLVVEGVMGLFDGSASGLGSTAHVAACLDMPVLLLLNAASMGQSAAALAEGFLRHRPAWTREFGAPRFCGLMLSHVGSPRHAEMLREALTPVCEAAAVPLLGLLPREGAPDISSRHLGLVQAHEALPGLDQAALADWLEAHSDLDSLLYALGLPPRPASAGAAPPVVMSVTERPAPFFAHAVPARPVFAARSCLRVGVAHDAAFSFCYADLAAVWAEEAPPGPDGAPLALETVAFSPLEDAAPPDCDACFFMGGYPELHAGALTTNTSMREALRSLAGSGVPMYGECGGYIYLMEELHQLPGEADGCARERAYSMLGLLPAAAHMGGRCAALGYREARLVPGWPGLPTESGQTICVRGHEYHYASAHTRPASGCAPLWELADSLGRPRGAEGLRMGHVAGSWLHLYPEGSRPFWRAWLALAARVSGKTASVQQG